MASIIKASINLNAIDKGQKLLTVKKVNTYRLQSRLNDEA